MNLRLQTTGQGSNKVLTKGLKVLESMVQGMQYKFDKTLKKYNRKNSNKIEEE